MAIEISIIDNTDHVSIQWANITAPMGSASIDIPKNSAMIEVVGDCVNVCYGKRVEQLDYHLVVLPVDVESAEDLRNKIKSYFYV